MKTKHYVLLLSILLGVLVVNGILVLLSFTRILDRADCPPPVFTLTTPTNLTDAAIHQFVDQFLGASS